jgi:DNA methyltransferase 1-associated protein 1
VEYPDYPFARFDIHLDPVSYTDEEYRSYLQSPSWTKSETDQLLELAKRYELRWPVIYDRWMQLYHEGSSYDSKAVEGKRIEDLQYRYYSVAAALMQKHISLEAAAEAQQLAATAAASAVAVSNEPSGDDPNTKRAQDHLVIETAAARALASTEPQHQPNFQHLGSGTSNKVFDLEHERERRKQMEALWNRTKEEEEEEAALRKELKQVEAQLRKLKKSGAHILAAGTFAATGKGVGATGLVSSAASSRNPSRAATPVHPLGSSEGTSPALLDQAFVSTAPKPTPQTPYLQSGRLAPPAAGGPAGINKTLLTRMETVLQEMKIPTRPLPTKRVCDLYDSVRKDLLTLLVLQKNSLQAEGLVASKRLKLAKLDGNVRALDEETLLGISMGGSPSSQASAAARAKSGGPARSKSKTASSAAHVPKSKEAGNKGREDATAVAANKRPGGKQARKPSTKRKRKIETPTAGGTAAVAAGDAAGKGSAASSSDTKPPAKKKSKKSG